MDVSALHDDFGVDVSGVDLNDVTADHLYPEIRTLFENHGLLLFRNQTLSDAAHLALGELFGPLEDRLDRPKPEIAPVANVGEDGSVIASDRDMRLLNLKANFLWHTDSTFLPVPALANILRARILPDRDGNTEFASSRSGFARLPTAVQERLRGTVFKHRYSHSRRKIDPELAQGAQFHKWPDQVWRAVWRNPVTGAESLYVASHVCAVDGVEDATAQAFVDDLITGMTGPDHVYSHQWELGDVLIWDERAVLHRGTPWPYDQKRDLASICVSLRDVDGLAEMRA